ncbi:hypothetical protein [Robertkochia solimangrovi]|uniref:hypothetical protein n=1 Tax=Robertkochia solimangrovi TaxID=2213046 RepID=UPI0011815966|nr:hypothetical protein [Robertkochia solimangrovi]TRZ42920.1 hypothetical protein DMZ48_12710 [Robertkochia solimangrovi]
MAKYFLSLIAIIILTKPVIPVVDYLLNTDYIIANFCENTDKPELHCDGKCYLMKMLAAKSEAMEKNKMNTGLRNIEIFSPLYFQEFDMEFGNRVILDSERAKAMHYTFSESDHEPVIILPPPQSFLI